MTREADKFDEIAKRLAEIREMQDQATRGKEPESSAEVVDHTWRITPDDPA